MKKVLALAMSAAMMLGLAACGGSASSTSTAASTADSSASSEAASTDAGAPVGDSITLKFGFSTNEEDPRAKAAAQFKAEVEEKTGGAITVELYPSGQLGGDADLINSLSLDSGTVDIIVTDASNFATYEPRILPR